MENTIATLSICTIIGFFTMIVQYLDNLDLNKKNKELKKVLCKAKKEYTRLLDYSKANDKNAVIDNLIADVNSELNTLTGRVVTVEESERRNQLKAVRSYLENRK